MKSEVHGNDLSTWTWLLSVLHNTLWPVNNNLLTGVVWWWSYGEQSLSGISKDLLLLQLHDVTIPFVRSVLWAYLSVNRNRVKENGIIGNLKLLSIKIFWSRDLSVYYIDKNLEVDWLYIIVFKLDLLISFPIYLWLK